MLNDLKSWAQVQPIPIHTQVLFSSFGKPSLRPFKQCDPIGRIFAILVLAAFSVQKISHDWGKFFSKSRPKFALIWPKV
jgi:hypothetical protein